MAVKVHGFIVDGGDGSSSVTWVRDSDYFAFVEWAEQKDNWEYYHDGDGLTDRIELEFDSYEDAESSGIEFQDMSELE